MVQLVVTQRSFYFYVCMFFLRMELQQAVLQNVVVKQTIKNPSQQHQRKKKEKGKEKKTNPTTPIILASKYVYEMVYLTLHLTHFIYGYMTSDIWQITT